MTFPVQITFHKLDTSPAVEMDIYERISKLASLYDRIIACHVVIEKPHRSHQHGSPYIVRIELSVPGTELVIRSKEQIDHQDIYIAVHDAFDEARRQLQDFVQKRRDEVKRTTPVATEP